MVGQTVSHYKILEHLGGGGMGIVYKAQDLTLNRPVALKFLPPELTRDPEAKERFVHEARAACSLDHQNICIVHEVAETEAGQLFLVMAFYSGETLKKKIERGRLDVREALDIARQVASGLAAAHEQGIVHRDIKPANIMITPEGVAKIVDFGLARLIGQSGITREGSTAGTAMYMSPEQSRGSTIDHRTDVWSLAVVLYEMLAGRPPFESDYESAVIYRILNEEAEPLRRLRPDVPPTVEAAVMKALLKNPDLRFQSVLEFCEGLGQPTARPLKQPQRKRFVVAGLSALTLVLAAAGVYFLSPRGPAFASVAVLPISNPGGTPELDYLCDGLSESLIHSLSQLPDLRVKSLSSVMRYRNRQTDAQDIGRELGVEAIVTGSAALQGSRLSIAMELVDVRDNSHLWGERWQSSLSDLLSLQQEVARAVPAGLRLRLNDEDETRLANRFDVSNDAYLLYLKGRYHWNRRTPMDIGKSIEYLEQALAIDPSYALAHAGLADCYNLLGSMEYAALPPSVAMPRARRAAEKALEIDERLAEAHVSLGHAIMFFDWDLKGAELEFRRAIELNPNYATARQWYGDCLMLQGRRDDALAEKKKALELDPLSLVITLDLGTARYYWREYDASIEQCQKTLDMDPTFLLARLQLARAYVQKKMYPAAIAELTTIRNVAPALTLPAALLGHVLGAAGESSQAETILRELTLRADHEYVPAHEFAALYAGLGRKSDALRWLRKAYEERSGLMVYLPLEPALDPLRTEPAFADLIRDVEKSTHQAP